MNSELLALHAFATLSGIGAKSLAKIRERGAEKLWRSGRLQDFEQVMGAGKRAYAAYEQYTNLDRESYLKKEEEYLTTQGIRLIDESSSEFPQRLAQISVPPAMLYVKGRIPDLDHGLSVVGTRKFTGYGERVCRSVVYDIARYGVPIISGLALGIDSIAHKACLEAGTPTIAVLGGGLDDSVLYPKSNRELVNRIIETGGAVVSEFHPKMQPRRETFPMRNRIVAGMSRGILVIEAPRKSGTMITVERALEENRDVFAIPGNIDQKTAEGTNYLIKQGATVVTEAQDILDCFGLDATLKEESVASFPPGQQVVITALSTQSMNLEQLASSTGQSVATLMTTLSLMELTGIVIVDGHGVYQLRGKIT